MARAATPETVFVERCAVAEVVVAPSGDASGGHVCRVRTESGHEVRCGRVVVATNGWLPRLVRAALPHSVAASSTTSRSEE